MSRNGLTWAGITPTAVPFWGAPTVTGHRSNAANWQETSGGCRAQKSANAGHSWLMSDGAINIIFAVRDVDAVARGEWTLTAETPIDLEDIASATIGGQPYIYLADTGNNADAADSRGAGIDGYIYRIEEPTITGSNGSLTLNTNFIKIAIAFPAGHVPSERDVECILVDPSSGKIRLLTKRIATIECYSLDHAASYTGTQTLTYEGPVATNSLEQNQTGSNGGYVVGGDVSPDGKLVALLGYKTAYVHQVASGMSIYDAIAVAGNEITTMREPGAWRAVNPTVSFFNPQREALWFDADSNLFVASEYLTAGGHGASNYPIYKLPKLELTLNATSFQDGVSPTAAYAGTRDTYFYKSATGGNQTVVRGTDATIITDYDSATDERNALVLWTLSAHIPTNAVVYAAELRLNISMEGQELYLHKILAVTWDETMSYATFPLGRLPRRDDIDAGSTVMGGYGSANFDTVTGEVRIILNSTGIACVQDWVTTPANNKGILLYAGTNTDGEQFHSREAVTASNRPRLTVWWYVP